MSESKNIKSEDFGKQPPILDWKLESLHLRRKNKLEMNKPLHGLQTSFKLPG